MDEVESSGDVAEEALALEVTLALALALVIWDAL